ncbi:serine/threonine-protein kinase [Actinokineospora soli]|uniref:non-specific serine/threonine protein kinase n=1 Tax=Actinokineospora soli TaxID=1048753 RepID=A0ABW2TXK1_9PSEU
MPPSLVRVYDAAPDHEPPYLVMQLIDGPTLRRRIDTGGALDLPTAARIGTRLADALACVHAHGIIHRDVKPANVLLDRDGGCYLTDFGIARALGSARLTSKGHCVGTAAYLAPEQVRGEPVGPAADIYALGLMLLECVTGRPEYEGPELEAAVARLSRPPRLPAWLPPVWTATLAAMTAGDPAHRPTAADCAQRLAAAALCRGPGPSRGAGAWRTPSGCCPSVPRSSALGDHAAARDRP